MSKENEKIDHNLPYVYKNDQRSCFYLHIFPKDKEKFLLFRMQQIMLLSHSFHDRVLYEELLFILTMKDAFAYKHIADIYMTDNQSFY